MQVNCINCGHKFDLGKNYDDYEGLVKCPTCRFLLDIRSEDGCIKRVRAGMMFPMQAAPAPTITGPVGTTSGEPNAPTLSVAPEPPPLRDAA